MWRPTRRSERSWSDSASLTAAGRASRSEKAQRPRAPRCRNCSARSRMPRALRHDHRRQHLGRLLDEYSELVEVLPTYHAHLARLRTRRLRRIMASRVTAARREAKLEDFRFRDLRHLRVVPRQGWAEPQGGAGAARGIGLLRMTLRYAYLSPGFGSGMPWPRSRSQHNGSTKRCKIAPTRRKSSSSR